MVDSKGKEACECDPTLRIEGASLPHPQVELRSDDQHHVFEASLEPSDPGEASHLQPVEDKDLPHPSMPDQKAVELPVHGQAPAELTSGININNSNTSIQPDGIEMHDGTPDLNNNNSVAEPKPLLDNKDEPADAYLLNNNSAETKIDQDMNLKPHNDMTEETNIAPDAKQLFTAKSEGSNVHHSDYHPLEIEPNDDKTGKEIKEGVATMEFAMHTETINEQLNSKLDLEPLVAVSTPNKSFHRELSVAEGYESGTEEEQAAFRKDVENFYRENSLEFKAPKFYKEELNLLKLWRQVIKLGGYEQVTSCKLWRQVGESFRPPKTCTTVSWTFRIFYEKALLEYEKHKLRSGELPFSDGPLPESLKGESQSVGNQALGSGRARRDAAARAMQGWHSQRLLDNGEVCHPIIKDKNLGSATKVDKQLKTNGAGLLKRKKPSSDEHTVNVAPIKTMKPQLGSDTMVIDIGPPADWVKINVQKMNDCFEIYALVPGLLREEVHVQSDPAGRLIISGQPEQVDNPWGITPFKKVVSLPSRIDPHQTSAVVTLHGQLFVRVPFEQSGH